MISNPLVGIDIMRIMGGGRVKVGSEIMGCLYLESRFQCRGDRELLTIPSVEPVKGPIGAPQRKLAKAPPNMFKAVCCSSPRGAPHKTIFGTESPKMVCCGLPEAWV